ncbi:MAG: alpha/beta hydrolase [Elusimicrobiota bacterium]
MIIFTLFLAAASFAAPSPTTVPVEQKVSFKTADGWTLSALYYPARKHGTVVILAHGVAASKAEWAGFTQRLALKGVGSLAFDLRGHADSKLGPQGPRDYTDFDATNEWPKAAGDFAAAADWLKSRGVAEEKIALGGASIGANLASVAAAGKPKTPFLLLLSAGPDYRGVKLRKPQTRTLAGASPPDQYAYQVLKPLAAVPGVETFEAPAGHGAQMFADPATLDKIVDWVVSASNKTSIKPAH